MFKKGISAISVFFMLTACGQSSRSTPSGEPEAKILTEISGVFQGCTASSANAADSSEAMILVVKPDASSSVGGSVLLERAKWNNNRKCQGTADSSVNSAKDLVSAKKVGSEYHLVMSEGTLNGSKQSNLKYILKKSGTNLVLVSISSTASPSQTPAARDLTLANITAVKTGVTVAPEKLVATLTPHLGKYVSCQGNGFNAAAKSEGYILNIESESSISIKKGTWDGVRDCTGAPTSTSDLASGFKELRTSSGGLQFVFNAGKYEGQDQSPIIYQFLKTGKDMTLKNIITINNTIQYAFDQAYEIPHPNSMVLKFQVSTRRK